MNTPLLDIVAFLLNLQNQYKIYHWQTKSFARHNAFGETYDALSDLVDNFVEVYMGKYGRFSIDNILTLELYDINNLDPSDFTNMGTKVLCELNFDPDTDTDLMNLRDEILSELNKLKYLLTLK